MSRQLRIIENNGYYHVTNRGVARRPTFLDEEDYLSFLGLLDRGCNKYGVRIVALALMPNHFHLLVWAILGEDVSSCMQWVTGIYAQYFNKRYERCGHLWQDRFFAKPIAEGRHLGTCWRYVEQNPVRAKLIGSPDQWEWSSAFMRSSNTKPNYLVEPPWWGSEIMKEWWSKEMLDPKTLDKIRRSVQKSELHSAGITWD